MPQQHEPPPAPSSAGAHGGVPDRHVLLVSRAPSVRAAITAALASIGVARLVVVESLAAAEARDGGARGTHPPLVIIDAISRPSVLPERAPVLPFAVLGDGNLTALRAFELGALDCLTLPIDPARLADVLRRASVAPDGRELRVDPAAVDWVEQVRGRSVIHAGDTSHETGEPLDRLERLLVGCRLLRVQAALAVNQDRVCCLELGPTGAARVVLDNGLVIAVEPRLQPAVHAALGG